MTARNIKRMGLITVAWILLSQILFYYAHLFLVSQVTPEILASTPYESFYTQCAYFLIALISGLFFGYFMVAQKPKLSTFYGSMMRIVGLFLFTLVAAIVSVTALITLIEVGVKGLKNLPQICIGVFTNKATLVTIFIWALILSGTQFMIQVSDKFGPGVLYDFLTGKYFNPVMEDRIFMFLDLKSSTTIAERIGHHHFFRFLREVFKDITQPIMQHQGEIYQYVGDEVVISWKMKNGIHKANCIRCFLAINEKLSSLASTYQETFDAIPIFKAGLHHGRVTTGEIGVIKKDIVFSGDVLNTTARIQGQCNQYQVRLIISEDTLSLLMGQCNYDFRRLGTCKLRGRKQEIGLHTLVDVDM